MGIRASTHSLTHLELLELVLDVPPLPLFVYSGAVEGAIKESMLFSAGFTVIMGVAGARTEP